MKRRDFVSFALGGTLIAGSGWADSKPRKVLFVCMDGCDPAYLKQGDLPNFKRMMASGMYHEGKSVMPSVTNVNNTSIATSCWPEEHGITGNYFYDRRTRKGTYMESPGFLLRPTLFKKAKVQGFKTAFVCSKNKLLDLIGPDAEIAFSAEKAPDWMQRKVGPKADVYSAELNYWAFRAARQLFREGSTLIFLSTTDYMMHTYAPESAPSLEHMHQVDQLLGSMVDENPKLEVYFTADHGMNAKKTAVDLGRLLKSRGIQSEAVPVIKDRYVAHHGNLGGCCYIYLEDEGDLSKAANALKANAAVEEVLDRKAAAARFHLKEDRIGGLVVLGRLAYAFGDLDHEEEPTTVRTHGSLHESTVPILCYGRKVSPTDYQYNFDISRKFEW